MSQGMRVSKVAATLGHGRHTVAFEAKMARSNMDKELRILKNRKK